MTVPLVVLHGFVMSFLFSASHECVHRTAFRSWLVVQLWLLPVLVGQPFLRAYLLAEHTGCPSGEGTAVGTRTTLTNPLMRFLAWNMPFHSEHHAHPQVPFHALPALHRRWADHPDRAQRGRLDRGYVRTVATMQRSRWKAARAL